MKTSYRDNAIERNRLILRLTLLWAIGSTLALTLLTCLCFYLTLHRETHWLPLCTASELSIGESSYSPAYLKEMTQKAIDLRLTYNPENIESRYQTLSYLIPANHLEAFKRLLDAEKKAVINKNMSSVFYIESVFVDVKHGIGKVEGQLARTSHGLQLNPQHKIYLLQFSFKNGLLGLESIKEVADESRN